MDQAIVREYGIVARFPENQSAFLKLAVLLFTLTLAACGSDSPSDDGIPQPGSLPTPSGGGNLDNSGGLPSGGMAESTPVAEAGVDQMVAPGATVNLDGSGSTTSESTDLFYLWSLTTTPDGSTAVISNASGERTSFVADVAGTYIAQLVVNDGTTDSEPDTVTIIAAEVPVVQSASSSNPPGVIPEGLTISCPVGPDTFESDSTCPVLLYNGFTYWAYSYRDNRSSLGIVAYNDAGEVVGQWEATGARYVWQITVDNEAATVTFFGQGSRSATLSFLELTPNLTANGDILLADAGTDQIVAPGDLVTLDSSGSSSTGSPITTYTWSFMTIPIGSSAVLSDANSTNPTFVADLAGTYVVQLTVND